jgi:hypothetical protein
MPARFQDGSAFSSHKAGDIASADVLERLQKAVEQWRRRWNSDEPPTLSYIRGPGWITIRDTRWDEPRHATLAGWRANAYQYCGDKAMGVSRIRAHLDESNKPGPSDAVLAKFLQACISSRIMLCEKESYLSLALPPPERAAGLDRVTHALRMSDSLPVLRYYLVSTSQIPGLIREDGVRVDIEFLSKEEGLGADGSISADVVWTATDRGFVTSAKVIQQQVRI